MATFYKYPEGNREHILYKTEVTESKKYPSPSDPSLNLKFYHSSPVNFLFVWPNP